MRPLPPENMSQVKLTTSPEQSVTVHGQNYELVTYLWLVQVVQQHPSDMMGPLDHGVGGLNHGVGPLNHGVGGLNNGVLMSVSSVVRTRHVDHHGSKVPSCLCREPSEENSIFGYYSVKRRRFVL